ncbi:O-antigen ligase family protein [Planotetraspora mira]|jgi:hypothetical protein|uniref:O-antigen ligase-related domain-containing protein n=1 Tax=Planotetraspora mira TaxID=58121 RepID=A0A8J3XBJ5_9ACTN|nr:O-antigen ligase family protein [Planotetraspora mira]GII30588.1 hypothetical protein Pmi06nite_40300 [Planotetraspora mira]
MSPSPTVLRQRADGATLVSLFALALLVIPARLVLRGLPMSLALSDVLSLIIGVVWFFSHFTKTLGAAKGRNIVRTAIFAYAIAMLVVYGHGAYSYLPSDELNIADHALVLIIGNLGLALAVCDGVRSRARLDFVLKSICVAGAIISFIGGLQFLFEFDLTHYLELPILRANSVEGVETVIDRSSFLRVASTTGHPIEFAVITAMILPIAAHYGFHSRDRGLPAKRWWVCTALVATGLIFSLSRSGVLAATVVGLVMFLGWPGKRRLQALAAVGVFGVAIQIFIPGMLYTFYQLFAGVGNDESIQFRVHDYPNALKEFLSSPWFGRGVGTWYAPKHQIFDNQYLLTMVEAGIVGLAAFALIIFVGVGAALRARYLSVDPAIRDLGLVLAACLLVPLVGSLTFDMMAFPQVTGLFFLLLGAAGALLRIAEAERKQKAAGDASAPREQVLTPTP